MYLRLMYIVSKLKIRQQYINRETHFPYILSTMIYNFVVQRANYQQKLYTPLRQKHQDLRIKNVKLKVFTFINLGPINNLNTFILKKKLIV